MNPPSFIPQLPDSAPFTLEQRAYLNGFFAGLFSRVPAAAGPAQAPAPALAPLTILYGSQTGTAEKLAKRMAKEAGQRGFAPTIQDLGKYAPEQLAAEQRVLIVTSTYGDGDPPDNAKKFWDTLSRESAPRLTQTRFAVLALGDTNYPNFCAFGKVVDARLEKLGAQRVHPRADCDLDFEQPYSQWLQGALSALGSSGGESAPAVGELDAAAEGWSRSNPFAAKLAVNRRLTTEGSGKEVRHFELSIAGAGLKYETGDALGVWPANAAPLVQDLLTALHCQGDEPVAVKGKTVSLRDALLRHYEITRIPRPFLQAMAERTGDATLRRVSAPDANGELTAFLRGREVIDLLLAHPGARFTPEEFLALLRGLQPRLYSISSSPRQHPESVHLTISVVRYESLGRARQGVCSAHLADRVPAGAEVPVFVHANAAFKPPGNPDAPLIMVGPGTGIAPFRAFLQERQAAGARGRNWLFFGDQRAATDFLYRDELEAFHRAGLLTRLDTAFSRDQADKIYVQHRMLENARELYDWLEAGAHFCVCGDASRMAKDVDAALRSVIETAGGKTAQQAAEYVEALAAAQRYSRDVY